MGAQAGWSRGEAPGHFGELLQGRLGPSGPLALITLPCAAIGVTAEFRPGGPLTLDAGPDAPLSLERARAMLGPAGALRLRWTTPPGAGTGASTAALTAAFRARAAAEQTAPPDPLTLARLCHAIEAATDPLMFPDSARLLWAPRAARLLDTLPPPPGFEVVGGFDGPPERTDPADLRFADITDLLALWRECVARGDLPGLAALATTSARRNRSLRGGPPLLPLRAIADATGALGIAAAHTGSARALLFAPGLGRPDQAATALTALGLSGILRFALAAPAAPV